jgi:small-conductance mechanosensitive channel
MNIPPIATAQLTVANAVLLGGSIAIVWTLLRYVRRRLESISEARPRTRPVFRLIESVLRISLWFAVLAFAMRALALSENLLFVVAASAAVALGLGARDLVRSLIGGLVIIADPPYEVGDRVTIAGTSGEIKRIGLATTKIATGSGAVTAIPNSKLLDGAAQRDTAGTPDCLVTTEVFLPLDVDPDLVLRVAREVLITCPYLCLRRPTEIGLSEAVSRIPYLRLKLAGYVYDHRFESQMQTDLLRRCKAQFRGVGLVLSAN